MVRSVTQLLRAALFETNFPVELRVNLLQYAQQKLRRSSLPKKLDRADAARRVRDAPALHYL